LFTDHPIATLDGVRVAFDAGWLLVRKSVTEPMVTVRIEAADEAQLASVRAQLLAAIPELRDRHRFFA
jgi:phosphomannomutase/phosphoglucomutase